MQLDEMDTPALVCDLDLLDQNLAAMADHCRGLEIPFRSHSKAHKIPEIADWQIASGSNGICCQKIGEAEVMVDAGMRDVLLPYNIVGPIKAGRLLQLARRAAITVAADSMAAVRSISEASQRLGGSVGVLIELEVGCVRTGVSSPAAARDLGRGIVDLPGVDLRGVMLYPSRDDAKPFLDETLELFRKDGLPTTVVSGGGTGAEAMSKNLGCTETRVGSYLWKGISCPPTIEEIDVARWPLRVVTTVVSVPEPGRIVVDAGLKTFGGYPTLPNCRCLEDSAIVMKRQSVEHGHCDVSESGRNIRVGDRLSFLPLHPELTINLGDELTGYRHDQFEVTWTIAGRGKVR